MATKITRKSTVEWVATGKATGLTAAIASAAYPVSGLTFDTYQSDVVEGGGYVGSYSPGKNYYGGEFAHVSFSMPFVGQPSTRGSAYNIPPYWGALLRACGFDETAGGGGNAIAAVYTQGDIHNLATGTTGLWPIDIKCNVDGRLKTVTSAVGTASFEFAAGSIPIINFEFWGQRGAAVASDATAQAALTLYKEPAQTGTYNLAIARIAPGGTASSKTGLVVARVGIDSGNNVVMRKDVNGTLGYAVPGISGRDPMYVLEIEDPGIATLDFEADWRSGVRYDVSFTHNPTAGIRQECAVAFGGFQVGPPAFSDDLLKATITLRQATETIGSVPVTAVPLSFTFASLAS